MKSWKETVRLELQNAERSQSAGNPGRARVCARRAVGVAIAELLHEEGSVAGADAMRALEGFLNRSSLPDEVAAAGLRLQARVRPDFTSASLDPVADAKTVIDYISRKLGDPTVTE